MVEFLEPHRRRVFTPARVVAGTVCALLIVLFALEYRPAEPPPGRSTQALSDGLAAPGSCGGGHDGHNVANSGTPGSPPNGGTAGPTAGVATASPPINCDYGPSAADFVDILAVPPETATDPPIGPDASTGSALLDCGRNEINHQNPDDFITSPGLRNGAHQIQDYVGNVTTNGLSTNDNLAKGATTCRLGDQSTYFWPVLRETDVPGADADADGGGKDGNVGEILPVRTVQLTFLGNAQARVTSMPRFLRIITGDAKAATNAPANAHAHWTCVGFTDRVTTKYPVCPDGAVQRVLEFPSCWDGKDIDSVDHRTHVAFPESNGACPQGTTAIPRLRITLTYLVPPGRSFAVDAFPEQRHSPLTDHAGFANLMPDSLMLLVVDCINTNRDC
jgi:hypothetical protein